MSMNDNGMSEDDFADILDSLPERPEAEQGMREDFDFLNVLLSKEDILQSKTVPEHIKNVLRFYNKTLALSNIERKDIFDIMEGLDDAKVAYIMGNPKRQYTWDDETHWTLLRNWLQIEATRGVDGFERTMEATQIHQSTVEQKQTRSSPHGGLLAYIGKLAGTGQ